MNRALALAALAAGGFFFMRGRRSRGQGRSTQHQISADGVQRQYGVYVSPSARPGAPLVILLHGRGGGMRTGRSWGWEPVADANGLVIVYGQALKAIGGNNPGQTGWNSRHGRGDPAWDNHPYSDVAYLDRVIADVKRRYGTGKTYVVGFSSGGMMAYRYAAERGDRIAGFAPLGGAIGQTAQGKSVLYAPMSHVTASALLIHGGEDNWKGGPLSGKPNTASWAPLAEGVKLWKHALGADREVSVASPASPVWHQRWVNGRGQAVEVLVDKGRGHRMPRWPWASYVWRFFATHS